MTNKDVIKVGFRALVSTMPYDKITVVSICQRCNIPRASFYDCFTDKDAVLYGIIHDDLAEPSRLLINTLPTGKIKSAPQLLTELIFDAIRDNAAFYAQINKVEHGSLLIRSLIRAFSGLNQLYTANLDLPADEKHYTEFFFAATSAELISHWLSNGLDLKPAHLAKLYNKWTLQYWQSGLPKSMVWTGK
jgi:AcrR family transcriptional regulator